MAIRLPCQTLYKKLDFRAVLISMEAGACMKEHQAEPLWALAPKRMARYTLRAVPVSQSMMKRLHFAF